MPVWKGDVRSPLRFANVFLPSDSIKLGSQSGCNEVHLTPFVRVLAFLQEWGNQGIGRT